MTAAIFYKDGTVVEIVYRDEDIKDSYGIVTESDRFFLTHVIGLSTRKQYRFGLSSSIRIANFEELDAFVASGHLKGFDNIHVAQELPL